MKDSTISTLITVIIIAITVAVIETIKPVEVIEEIQVQTRERVFMCPCARDFGRLQEHLDCHEDRQ